jgi:hypothetical protein
MEIKQRLLFGMLQALLYIFFSPSHQSDVTDLSFITTAGLEVVGDLPNFQRHLF